ncbi:MAG: enoyl-CoA hydratase/isomerase family protein [Dehalococcoidia bacterium]
MSDEVLYERRGHVASITLNRPESLNAMNGAMSAALRQAWHTFRDDTDAWVAILTGAGDRAFCAGADVKDLAARGRSNEPPPPFVAADMDPSMESGYDIFKPTIAAINGYCIGIGLTVAMACDFRIAAEHARFGYTEVRLGIPTIIGAIRTSWVTGMQTALEMLLTGEIFDIEYARQKGFLNKVVPGPQVMEEAERLAERLCQNGPLAMRVTKEVLVRGQRMPLPEAWRLGEALRAHARMTEDAKEGPRAFAEKRPANFKGR